MICFSGRYVGLCLHCTCMDVYVHKLIGMCVRVRACRDAL